MHLRQPVQSMSRRTSCLPVSFEMVWMPTGQACTQRPQSTQEFFLNMTCTLRSRPSGFAHHLQRSRAALEKDDRPDAGAIVHIVFLHIEDQSFSFHLASFS